MGTTGVTLGNGRTMPEVDGTACLITRVSWTVPPATMGNLAGVGNTTGMVASVGPGTRGRFTMAALRTPEPEALNWAGSSLLVKETVVVTIVFMLVVVIAGPAMIEVVAVAGGTVVTGSAVVTGGADTVVGVTVVMTTGVATVAGRGINERGTTGGNKSSGRGSFFVRMLRAAS